MGAWDSLLKGQFQSSNKALAPRVQPREARRLSVLQAINARALPPPAQQTPDLWPACISHPPALN